MRLRLTIAFFGTAFLLSACAHWDNPAWVQTIVTPDLCSTYEVFATPMMGIDRREWAKTIKAELNRRGAVAPGEWPLIDQQKIRVGMSECALLASWGSPLGINHTVTAAGDSAQYVYGGGNYAYVTNGRVTGMQASY
jgi:hypothetical protein